MSLTQQSHAETLLALSHAMRGAIARHQFDSLQGLIEERGKIVRELQTMILEGPLSADLANTLKEALDLGEQSYLPLMTRRVTAREDLKLLRRRRQNQLALRADTYSRAREKCLWAK